jgi:hypothetical protein
MNEHTACGRCGGPDLYRIPATPGGQSKIVLGDRLMQGVEIAQYVCTDCGYIEEWVNDHGDLHSLKLALAERRLETMADSKLSQRMVDILADETLLPTYPRMRPQRF